MKTRVDEPYKSTMDIFRLGQVVISLSTGIYLVGIEDQGSLVAIDKEV